MNINFYTLSFIISMTMLESTCKSTKTKTVIMLDETEESFNHISLSEYQHFSSLNTNIFNGEEVEIMPITESGYNKEVGLKIPFVLNAVLGNSYTRKKVVKKYYLDIDSVLTELKKERRKRNGSVIFKVLSEKLNELSTTKEDNKVLIINSDLMENSFVDFTREDMIDQIKDNPEKIEKLLTDKYPLNDLRGISIYIVYAPINKWDSERFEIVSNLYNQMLSKRGAKVKISGNLN